MLKATPFSSRATIRRGIAAAVPFSVCAKVVGLNAVGGEGDSESGEEGGVGVWYEMWSRRDW